jgi:nitrite reductase/ring-hydroxylating ferredoxin subunit
MAGVNWMTEFIKVAQLGEIPVGGSKLVEVEGIRVALFNLDGKIYAIEDVCTHDGSAHVMVPDLTFAPAQR